MAAVHAWQQHGWQRMYESLGLDSVLQPRNHIAATVWHPRTECFIASNDREVYYDRVTNTRVIFNYRQAGTCLITRTGAKEFARQYQTEMDRHVAAGNDLDSMPPIVSGGIRALYPDIPSFDVPPQLPNGDQTRH
jgi:hypothetical protein